MQLAPGAPLSIYHSGFTIYDACVLKLEQLAELLERNRAAASARVKEFSIGGTKFDFNSRPAIMGVVNLSPDSWYRESVCLTAEAAVQRAAKSCAQGADIVDVGAESTLAHAARVDGGGAKFPIAAGHQGLRAANIPVSVETYQPAVTRACLEAGANVLNLTGTDRQRGKFSKWSPRMMPPSLSVTCRAKTSAKSAILI